MKGIRKHRNRRRMKNDPVRSLGWGAERGVLGVLSKTQVTRIEPSLCSYMERKIALKQNYLLLSFPRSGSTYLRYMLEWFGRGHEVNGKPDILNEVVDLESCLIHKAHYVQGLERYEKVLFLHRDPFECLYSNIARSNYLPETRFLRNKRRKPSLHIYKELLDQVNRSIRNYECVLSREPSSVLVMTFDNLLYHPMENLLRVFDFVGEEPVKEITEAEVRRITEKSHNFYHTKYAGAKNERREHRRIIKETLEKEHSWRRLLTLSIELHKKVQES